MQESYDLGFTTMAAVVDIDDNNKVQGMIDFMLLFRKRDPIVITIILKYGMQVGKWEVSRDLMVKGVLYGLEAGEGDFKISAFKPKDDNGNPVTLDDQHEGILFTFTSRDDDEERDYTTRVVARKHIVKDFLEKTITMMPRSLETQEYDIDELIAKLLEE